LLTKLAPEPHWLPESAIYSTNRGTQLVGDSRDLLERLPTESIDLIVTSPPFALIRKKSYGNEDQGAYADWLAVFGKKALRVLKSTGSFVLDLGGAYEKGRPVRSLYPFRVLLTFVDQLGFHLAEDFYWFNPARLPSPIEWVNKRKVRVKDSVNTVWWLSKTPEPKADVRRVLQPYRGRMLELLKDPDRFYAPKVRPSGHDIGRAFRTDNGGSIPSNLLTIPNTDSNSFYLRTCKALGYETHPARFPGELPRFFIRMLTEPGDVVLDIFSGSNTTGSVAELEDRSWISMELDQDYAARSAIRFLENRPTTEIQRIIAGLRTGSVVNF